MGRFRRSAFTVALVLAVLLSANTFTYLNFDPTFGFLKHKQIALATGWYQPAFYAHIFAGGVVLLAGFLQFTHEIRRRFKPLHRATGYIYVIGILVFAAPGGLIMAFHIDRGPLVMGSFLLQCFLWAFFTLAAFQAARKRRLRAHGHWMMRSFSLTLAAISLRIYILGASWFLDLSEPGVYAIFAWLSWVPNLALAEVLIRKKITSGPDETLAPVQASQQ